MFADLVVVNAMLIDFRCVALWVKNRRARCCRGDGERLPLTPVMYAVVSVTLAVGKGTHLDRSHYSSRGSAAKGLGMRPRLHRAEYVYSGGGRGNLP